MAKLLQSNLISPESLSGVFEHLSVQVEDSKSWKCAFPSCTSRVPRNGLPDLAALVSSIGDFRLRSPTATPTTTDSSGNVSELAEDIAKITCVDHREQVKKLFFSDIQDDAKGVGKPSAEQSQVQKDVSQESVPFKPLPPSTPARKAPGRGRHMDTHETNTPRTDDDPGYFTKSNGKGKAEKWTVLSARDEGYSSPFSPETDSVFDDDSPRGAIETPGTPYSSDSVSRNLWSKQRGGFDETPIRNKSYRRLAASQPKAEDDQDTLGVHHLGDMSINTTKHIDTVEEDHNSYDDNGSSDEAPPQPTVDAPKVQVVEAYTVKKLVSKPKEDFFRARAIFDYAFRQKFNKTDKLPGRIYIAIDINDVSLKDHFKIGIVENENKVSKRYTDERCQRKHSLSFVAISERQVLSVRRVEWLVQRELHTYRKKFNCKHCSQTHREWFKVKLPTVLEVVNRWIMFTSLAVANNGNAEELCKKMIAFMDRRYDLQSIVDDFILESGGGADQRKMTTFVDVTKKKSSKGAKDLKMMKEWEQRESCIQEVLSEKTKAGAEK